MQSCIPVGYYIIVGPVTLQDTDMYLSRHGTWEPCPCPGIELQRDCRTIWVRPR